MSDPTHPRGPNGRYIKAICPECGDPLQIERRPEFGSRFTWSCTGLVDPEDVSKPLAACRFVYLGGDEFPSTQLQEKANG